MSKLMRHYSDGKIYFITTVTEGRAKILIEYHSLLRDSLAKFKNAINFDVIAHVELPDHIHLLIDPRESTPSEIMQKVKFSFSKKVRYILPHQSGSIWQSRFWDHMIRDQDDMNRHIDYIHYNPVKHGYVGNPFEWRFSSIHEYVQQGYYAEDWGMYDEIDFDGEFGE